MAIDLPVGLLIAAVALLVASTVAQRAGERADERTGLRSAARAAAGGPFRPLVALVDESVAAYALRSRLGRPTSTRAERHAARERAAAEARAEEIRRMRGGAPSASPPVRLVVAGSPPAQRQSARRGPRPARATSRSTVSVELLAAGLGLAVVIGIVIGIWPREEATGAVLSATATPAEAPATSPSNTPSTELVEALPAT